jgi:hypothetical protein
LFAPERRSPSARERLQPVVWACAPSKTAWACLHVIRRHGGIAQEVVVLELDVPRSWLKRHGGAAKALWYSVRDVTPEHIRRIITFGELSRSPVEEEANRRPRLVVDG